MRNDLVFNVGIFNVSATDMGNMYLEKNTINIFYKKNYTKKLNFTKRN